MARLKMLSADRAGLREAVARVIAAFGAEAVRERQARFVEAASRVPSLVSPERKFRWIVLRHIPESPEHCALMDRIRGYCREDDIDAVLERIMLELLPPEPAAA